jgi:hypothetical protein
MTAAMSARLVVLLLLLVGARAEATVVRFDALEPRTVLTDQLRVQGVVFQPFENVTFGVIVENYMGKVAEFSYAHSMEFPPWGARGSFTVAHREVHMHVAVAPKWGATEMILTAFDRFGRTVGKSHLSITPASGFDNELAVRSSSAEIVAFTLEAPYGTNTGPPLVYDIVFDDPAPLDLGGVGAAVARALPLPSPVPSESSSTSPSTSTITPTPTITPTSTSSLSWLEGLLLAVGILLLLGLIYFLWRSR